MSGIKYILRNECTSPALITYQNYSNQLWQYQVEFLPGQTRTIWATEGTLSYDTTRTCIKVLSQTTYPSTSTTPSQPSTNPNVVYTNQYLIQVSTMINSNNWEYSVLNYENATIVGPVDLGFSPNDDWYFDNVDEALNGWMLVFGNDLSDDKKVYFINKSGSINYVYQANTNYNSYDTHSNRFATYIDYDNLKCIFSDFSTTYTYNIPQNWDDFYVDYNYDSGNYVGVVIYQRINNYSEYILFKPSGYQTLFNYNNDDYYVQSFVYQTTNFFGILVGSNYNEEYSFYNVYNSNGVLINSINLEANSLTSISSVNNNTSNVSGGINGTFTVEQSSTSISGTNATFEITISSGTVLYVQPIGRGINYTINEVITFNGTLFGGTSGVDNINVTVSSLGEFPLEYYDVQFFGDSKMSMIFYSNFNQYPYFIVIYDGITNEFYTTSHNRNAGIYAYYGWEYMYSDKYDYSAPNQLSNDLHINFNDDDGSWYGSFYSVDDCDIVSWFDSTKEFSIYELAKNINYDYSVSLFNYYVGKSLLLPVDFDNGYITYVVIQSTGDDTINVISTGVLNSFYLSIGWCGDYLVCSFDLGSSDLFFIHKYDGTQIDSLYLLGGYGWQTEYNSFFIYDYQSEVSYYWNASINSILQTEYFNDYSDINYYNTTSNKNNGQQLLWNYDNYTSRILTQNSLSVLRTLPVVNDNFSVKITRNLVAMVTYNNGGKFVVYVYDLNFNLLNTVTTNETSWDTFTAQENRIYLQTYDASNNAVHYLITANTFKKVVTSDYDLTYRFNDWE